MLKQKFTTPYYFLLALLLLVLRNSDVSAQWWVNTTTPADLETQTTVFPYVYNNVIIDNHLGINVATTGCPIAPGSTMLVDYPLVVNTLSGGTPSDGTAIVLWDNSGADNLRKVIGLSQNSGIGLFSGSDATNGSALFLNATGTTTTLHPPGSVQGFSIGSGLAGSRAFELWNYIPPTTSPAVTNNIFGIDQNGDTRITGNLSFPLLGGDNDFRLIKGLSHFYGINFTSAKATNGSEGACFTAISGMNTTYSVPGISPPYNIATGAYILKVYSPVDALNPGPLAYALQGWEGGLGDSIHNYFLINDYAQGIIGHDVQLNNISNGDALTVK